MDNATAPPPKPLTSQELLHNFTLLVQRAADAHAQLVAQVQRSQAEQEALQRSLKQLQDSLGELSILRTAVVTGPAAPASR